MQCRRLPLVVGWLSLVSLLSTTPTCLAFISSSLTAFHLRTTTTPTPTCSNRLLASIDEETTSSPASSIPLVVEGKNIKITEALMEHVNKRLGGPLKKLGKNVVRECDVVLSVSRNPKVKNGQRVEVIANLKGTTVICNFESPDMYESIDSAAHALYRKLVKYKERREDGWHGGASMGEDLQAALESMESDMAVSISEQEEQFVDLEAPQITKVNSFDLKKKMSVQEAIFALDYIDHDFYVFRSEETDKITVVYKRHGGGIGLIEP